MRWKEVLKMEQEKSRVWQVFVGDSGGALRDLCKAKEPRSPFPPRTNTEGLIAIGWPELGDLRLHEKSGALAAAIERIYKLYRDDKGKNIERGANIRKTIENMLTYFFDEMSSERGDVVVCPSKPEKIILFGKIAGPYCTIFTDEDGFVRNTKPQLFSDLQNLIPKYPNLRKVFWLTHVPYNEDNKNKYLQGGRHTVLKYNENDAEHKTKIENIRLLLNSNGFSGGGDSP
jgi:hypothetical protein